MLRRDYMLKLIEQFAKIVAKLLNLDYVSEPQLFTENFDELLKSYFKLSPDELSMLLTEDEKRDALLLDENSKNSQLSLFARAGIAYFSNNDFEKAKICLKIIERIEQEHQGLFEFPNPERQKIHDEIDELRKKTEIS